MTLRQKRRDWFQIIRVDLAYAGISQAMVARACSRDPKTIENWTLGNEPKDTDARIVLAMYRKFCPDQYLRHMKEFQPDLVEDFDIPPPPPKPGKTFPESTPQFDLFELKEMKP